MKENINFINNNFINNNDLINRKIKINIFYYGYIFFLDSMCSQDKINDYILKCIVNKNILKNIDKMTYGSNIKKIKKKDIINNMYNGYTILLIKNNIYAIETKANITRSVSPSENESSMKGPKEAFTENMQTNLGLIKRRIKSPNLMCYSVIIGNLSKNNLNILYLNNKYNEDILNDVINKLNTVNMDIVNDTENLNYLFTNKLFPKVITTERPDRTAYYLSMGKIVILMDNSPNAIILPIALIDLINPYTDKYSNKYNILFTKIIRFICFFLTTFIPGFYIAIINYNQETIPSSLIINFASQRMNVPFPAIIECILMLLICEILRESDLRFPNKYGSAISILGALVIGDAAVSAGLVSPIMIIITSLTYISSLIFAEIEIANTLRYYRFLVLLLSSILGLYGFSLSLLFFLVNLCSINYFNFYYTYPLTNNDTKDSV